MRVTDEERAEWDRLVFGVSIVEQKPGQPERRVDPLSVPSDASLFGLDALTANDGLHPAPGSGWKTPSRPLTIEDVRELFRERPWTPPPPPLVSAAEFRSLVDAGVIDESGVFIVPRRRRR